MSTSDPYDLSRSILQKLSCLLSLIGSHTIISSITRNKPNLTKPQKRLLRAISLCDLSTSTVWFFTDLIMPPREESNLLQCPRIHRTVWEYR
mmetsp:Transcript_22499/g.45199  ORF Transcript_22499/g.45199 Transcript_22499/m.45199 type:complete len:92 (+) Transcript_22499:59-334(+)